MNTRRDMIRQAIMALAASAIACLVTRWGMAPPNIELFPPICPPSNPAPAPLPPSVPPVPLPPAPIPPAPVPPPQPKLDDPFNAIAQISASGAGCSATVIGPKRADGKYWVLTAAHCVRAGGQRWSMRFRSGKTAVMNIVRVDDASDCAWGLTDGTQGDLPYALVADRSPAPGTKIWHAGFGVRVPGNIERGEVVLNRRATNQTYMKLSVSSGDSGGGIFQEPDGKLISTVCCTVGDRFRTDTAGASVEAIRRIWSE